MACDAVIAWQNKRTEKRHTTIGQKVPFSVCRPCGTAANEALWFNVAVRVWASWCDVLL